MAHHYLRPVVKRMLMTFCFVLSVVAPLSHVFGQSVNFDVTLTPPTCYGGDNGKITITITAGTTKSYTIWRKGSPLAAVDITKTVGETIEIGNLDAEMYDVKVYGDDDLARSKDNIKLDQPTKVTLAINDKKPTCGMKNTGGVTLAGAGGSGGFTYSLNGGAYTATTHYTGLGKTEYTVMAKDTKGCLSDESKFTLTTYDVQVNVDENVKSCAEKDNGKITVSGNNGVGSYQYSFDGGAYDSKHSWTDLAPKTYTVIVRDDDGCVSASKNIVVEKREKINVSLAGSSDAICLGSNVLLKAVASNGTAPYLYEWSSTSGSGLNTPASGSDIAKTPTVAKDKTHDGAGYVYHLKVTDANDCPHEEDLEVDVHPTYSGEMDRDTTCPITTFTWTPNAWNTPIAISGLATSTNVSHPLETRYFHCDSVVKFTLVVLPVYDQTATPKVRRMCNAYLPYTWENDVNALEYHVFDVPEQVNMTFHTKVGGCDSVIAIKVETQELQINSLTNMSISCPGASDGKITIGVTGGVDALPVYNYSIDDGDHYQASNVFSSLDPGLYQVKVQDKNHEKCVVKQADVEIADKMALAIATTGSATETCKNSPATLKAAGLGGTPDYTYVWSSSNPNAGLPAIVNTKNITVTPSADGDITYTVTMTDANGCSTTENVVLTVHPTFAGSVQDTDLCQTPKLIWTPNAWNTDVIIDYPTTSSMTQHLKTRYFACDSAVTLNIIIRPVYATPVATATKSICNSDLNYKWYKNDDPATETYVEFSAAGNKVGTFKTAFYECDSAVSLTLDVKPNPGDPYMATACDKYTWKKVGDKGYGTDLDYTFTGTQTILGTTYYQTYGALKCYGNDILTLTIDRSLSTGYTRYACDSFYWSANPLDGVGHGNGMNYGPLMTGTYIGPLYGTGCPNRDTLKLEVIKVPHTVYTENYVCDSFKWMNHGWDSIIANSGQYIHRFTYVDGMHACPSSDTLNITLYYGSYNAYDVVACDKYTWEKDGDKGHGTGETFYVSGITKGLAYENADFCPGMDTLHLTMNHQVGKKYAVTMCDQYLWAENGDKGRGDGHKYTATGVYVGPAYFSAANCESHDTLVLTILPSTHNIYNHTVCDNDNFVWQSANGNGLGNGNDQPYSAAGKYAGMNYYDVNGCASRDTLVLSVNLHFNEGHKLVACDKYHWEHPDGTAQWIDASNKTAYLYVDANGCNSRDTLDITIQESASTKYIVNNVCDQYVWSEAGMDVDGHGNGATYVASGLYIGPLYLSDDGCESHDTLELILGHSTHDVSEVATCGTYTWDAPHGTGITYTATGDYKGVEYLNGDGCVSIDTLKLTIVESNTVHITNEWACDQYTWAADGITYYFEAENDVQHHRAEKIDAITGCKFTDSLILTLYPSTHKEVNVAACEQYTWLPNGNDGNGNGATYFVNGTYTNSYTNASGCPSEDKIILTINHNESMGYKVTVCDTFRWNDAAGKGHGDNLLHSQSGVFYGDVYQTAMGCSSRDTLYLTINNSKHQSYEVERCGEFTWKSGDAYGNGTNVTYKVSGDYAGVKQENAVTHCFDVDTLRLTILSPAGMRVAQTVCDNYTWKLSGNTDGSHGTGNTYEASALLTSEIYTNAFGCETRDTLNLVVNANASTAIKQVACDSFAWSRSGLTYYTAGDKYFDYQDANGCAATDTLHLTLRQAIHNVEYLPNECDSYTWTAGNGNTYTTEGTFTYTYNYNKVYEDITCPSVDTLKLTIRKNQGIRIAHSACDTYRWDFDGTEGHGSGLEYDVASTYYGLLYADDNGCPAVDTLVLTLLSGKGQNTTTAACEQFQWTAHDWDLTLDESGEYLQPYTKDNGCPAVDTLHLTINNGVGTHYKDTVCDSYTWTVALSQNGRGNDQTLTVSATYVGDGYNDPVTGCETHDTLSLVVRHNTHKHLVERACESYDWFGNVITEQGTKTYYHTSTNEEGCTAKDTLELTIYVPTIKVYDTVVCDSFVWAAQGVCGRGFDTTIYETPLTNIAGPQRLEDNQVCNTHDEVHLTVNHGTHNVIPFEACEQYTWVNADNHGYGSDETYTESGRYPSTVFPDVVTKCPSVDTLALTVNKGVHNTYAATACEQFYWASDGLQGVGTGLVYTESGTYKGAVRINATTGCEDFDTLVLEIKKNAHNRYEVLACDEFVWPASSAQYGHGTGDTYTVGSYKVKGPDYTDPVTGCTESNDSLILNVVATTHSKDTVAACDTFYWAAHDTILLNSSVYYKHYNDANGCPVVDTLVLGLSHSVREHIYKQACDSFDWNIAGTSFHYEYLSPDTIIEKYGYLSDGACKDTAILHLWIDQSTHDVIDVTECVSYVWDDHGVQTPYNATGVYEGVAYTNAKGCDSRDTLVLTIHADTGVSNVATACDSYVWTYGGNDSILTATGTYYSEPHVNGVGCTSVDTLMLTVNSSAGQATMDTVCDQFLWATAGAEGHGDGNTYTTSQIVVGPLYTKDNGCETKDTLFLTVMHTDEVEETFSGCDSFTWMRPDSTTATYRLANDYIYHYNNAAGCPSVATLHLTIKASTHQLYLVNDVCDSFRWDMSGAKGYGTGETYAADVKMAGAVYTNNEGCESVDTLTLVLHHSQSAGYTWQACDSFRWDNVNSLGHYTNRTYTQSGDYLSDAYASVDGCLSVDTLHLTILPSTHHVLRIDTCANSYTWNVLGEDLLLSASGTYTSDAYTNDLSCQSVDTLFLTLHPSHAADTHFTVAMCGAWIWDTVGNYGHGTAQAVAASGTYYGLPYKDVNGCENVDTLFFTYTTPLVNTMFDTVACDFFRWVNHGVDSTFVESTTFVNEYTDGACSGADTLQVVINHASHDVISKTACNTYTWTTSENDGHNNHTYTESAIVTGDVFVNAEGCESVDTLHLTILNDRVAVDTFEVCNSFVWTLDPLVEMRTSGNGATLTESGVYTSSYTNDEGCITFDTLKLTVNYSSVTNYHDTVCFSYTWAENGTNGHGTGATFDHNVETANSYTDAKGCVSVDSLFLVITQGTYQKFEQTACDSFRWENNGWDSLLTVAHTYVHRYENHMGCPSADTLVLTLNAAQHTDRAKTACDSFLFRGTYLTESGRYACDSVLNATTGCYDVDTLRLSIFLSSHQVQEQVVCDSYTWSKAGAAVHATDSVYTQSGRFPGERYTNANGCESVDTLALTVYYGTYNVTVVDTCADHYDWVNADRTDTYTAAEAGTYTYIYTNSDNCPSADTLHLAFNTGTHNVAFVEVCDSFRWYADSTWFHGDNNTYYATDTITSSYVNEGNCASVDTLFLTINNGTHNSYDTVVCEQYRWLADGDMGHGLNRTFNASIDTVGANYLNENGCVSNDTLHLTIERPVAQAIHVDTVNEYRWTMHGFDSVFTADTVMVHTYPSELGTCVNSDTLFLTIRKSTHRAVNVEVCEQYTWELQGTESNGNGLTYTESGTYIGTAYRNAFLAECVDTLHLTILHGTHTNDTVVACEQFNWPSVGGLSVGTDSTYTVSGVYESAYTNAEGCASVDTLVLTVNYNTSTRYDVTSCESFTWETSGAYGHGTGMSYDINQTVVGPGYNTAEGCASRDTMVLHLDAGTYMAKNITACNSYIWADTVWHDGYSQTLTTSDTYTHEYTNVLGCHSVDTLHLTVNASTSNTVNRTACDTFYWDSNYYHGTNNVYTASGRYGSAVYENENGCPSIDTLVLTINGNEGHRYTKLVCESFTWANGGAEGHGTDSVYTETGIYTGTLYYSAVGDCQSIDTLDLTVNNGSHNVDTVFFCSGSTYTWNTPDGESRPYNALGIYTHNYNSVSNGCPSTDTLRILWGEVAGRIDTTICDAFTWANTGLTYTESDTIFGNITTNANGCQVRDTLVLTVNNNESRSYEVASCGQYTWAAFDTTAGTANATGHGTADIYEHSAVITGPAYTSQEGCASVDTLKLTVNNLPNAQVITLGACDSFQWIHHGIDTMLYLSGNYTHTYTNGPCTLTDTLVLTVTSATHDTMVVSECDSYTWNTNGRDGHTGMTYTTSGVYVGNAYTNASNCESRDTLHLTIRNSAAHHDTVESCNEYAWLANAMPGSLQATIGTDSIYRESGVYVNSYLNAEGCTTNDTLVLTINTSAFAAYRVTACENYTWAANGTEGHGNDSLYNFPGIFVNYYDTPEGCHSADTLYLTINFGSHFRDNVTTCDSFRWENHGWDSLLTIARTYTHNYLNSDGCPSTDTLVLALNHSIHNEQVKTACDSLVWQGISYTASGRYPLSAQYDEQTRCLNVDTLVLTINQGSHNAYVWEVCDNYTWLDADGRGHASDSTYTVSGRYAGQPYFNAAGCQSVDTLVLTVNYATHNVLAIDTCAASYAWQHADRTDTYTSAQGGIYTYDYTNASSCPSSDTLFLSFNTGSHEVVRMEVCESFTWVADSVYGHGNGLTYNTTGVYTSDYINDGNCASVDTLYLTVNNGTFASYDVVACGQFVWEADGNYGHGTGRPYSRNLDSDPASMLLVGNVYVNEYGCESRDTLHLAIELPAILRINKVECDSFRYNLHGIDTLLTASTMFVHQYASEQGACQNIDTIALTINASSHDTFYVSAPNTYTWSDNQHGTGNAYNESGVYVGNEYRNEYGCASVDTLHLTINNDQYHVDSVTACDSYLWASAGSANLTVGNDSVYTVSGTYLHEYVNADGTMSHDTLYLTVNHNTNARYQVTACDSYVWESNGTDGHGNGTTYRLNRTVEGPQYLTAEGCPSVDTLELRLLAGTRHEITIEECDSYIWSDTAWHDGFADTLITTDTYTHNYTNAQGCPSSDVLNLTIKASSHRKVEQVACGEYVWDSTFYYGTGLTYTESGRYASKAYTNNKGCESVDTLVLTINAAKGFRYEAQECEQYVWGLNSANGHGTDSVYTQSGRYVGSLYYIAGNCAVSDTLDLIVYNGAHRVDTTVLCQGSTYTWQNADGRIYDRAGTYTYNYSSTENGCASVDTLRIFQGNVGVATRVTVCDSFSWIASAAADIHPTGRTYFNSDTVFGPSYTNAQGCTGVDTLYLTVNHNSSKGYRLNECDYFYWDSVGNYGRGTAERYISSRTVMGPEYFTAEGCRSVDTLFLNIDLVRHNILSKTACDSFLWSNNGFDTLLTESGIYTHDYAFGRGDCHSTDTLRLTIENSLHPYYRVEACDAYQWVEAGESTSTMGHASGETYTESGHYAGVPYVDMRGCVNVDTLDLTIHYAGSARYFDTACDSYRWPVMGGLGYGSNQTFDSTGIYLGERYRTDDGCQSRDTLQLFVYNSTHNVYFDTVCDAFTWEADGAFGHGNGQTYSATGVIAGSAYTDEHGCRSVDTLYLAIRQSTNTELTINACDSFTWIAPDGYTHTFYGDADREHEYMNEVGCLSVEHLVLTMHSSSHFAIAQTVCDSFTWTSGHGTGETYYTSGEYESRGFTNEEGCLSHDILQLTINASTHEPLVRNACDEYTWTMGEHGTGRTYRESGVFVGPLYSNALDCPSVDTLYLTMGTSTSKTDSVTSCDSYVWNFPEGGHQSYFTSGSYTHRYSNEEGCPSIDTLVLTLTHSTHNNYMVDVCEQFTWDTAGNYGHGSGLTYTTSQVVVSDTFMNVEGCPSLDTLTLTIRNGRHFFFFDTVCDGYLWATDGENGTGNGELLTESGRYGGNPYPGTFSCPNIDSLILTVNRGRHNIYFDTVCGSFTWDLLGNFGYGSGETYTTSGVYAGAASIDAATGCTNADTLYLTVYPNDHNVFEVTACESFFWNSDSAEGYGFGTDSTYATSGTYVGAVYSNISNCVSVDTLRLTINHGSHRSKVDSACDQFFWAFEPTSNYVRGNDSVLVNTGIYVGSTYMNALECPSNDTLFLIIKRNGSTRYVTTQCERFVWNNDIALGFGHGNDTAYTENGVHLGKRYLNQEGCESVDTLDLTILSATHKEQVEEVCNTYTWPTQDAHGVIFNEALTMGTDLEYTESGRYAGTTYMNELGCPSVDTLVLTVHYGTFANYDTVACDSLLWRLNGSLGYGTDTYITQPGAFAGMMYRNEYGCESVDTLHLTLRMGTHFAETHEVCSTYVWNNHGQIDTLVATGTYVHNYANNVGCPSSDTLMLSVRDIIHGVYYMTACESFTWSENSDITGRGTGRTYTESGVYAGDTYIEGQGCDAIDTLILTINHGSHNGYRYAACGEFRWDANSNYGHGNGSLYTESGRYYGTPYLNEFGCESSDSIELTVLPARHTVQTVVACDSYTWTSPNGRSETFRISQPTLVRRFDTVFSDFSPVIHCMNSDTLHLTINRTTQGIDNQGVVCDSLRWHDMLVTESTRTLTAKVENAAGCDSIITLQLQVKRSTSNLADTLVCGDYFEDPLHAGIFYYHDTVVNTRVAWGVAANGCNYAEKRNVHLHPNYSNAQPNRIDTVVCDQMEWTGEIHRESTVLQQRFRPVVGSCDSVVEYHITVRHSSESEVLQVVCDSDYMYGNDRFTTGINTLDTVARVVLSGVNAEGCDSVVTLHLVLSPVRHVYDRVFSCETYTWPTNGRTYTRDTKEPTEFLLNRFGCDSVVTLDLTITHPTRGIFADTACGSYTWWKQLPDGSYFGNGRTYTQEIRSRGPIDTLQERGGCDSVVELRLVFRETPMARVIVQACENYTWATSGETYTRSGRYLDTIAKVAQNGNCDSIYALELTVNPAYHQAVSVEPISACESFEWNGTEYTENDTLSYTDTTVNGCDSVVAAQLIIYHQTEGTVALTGCEQVEWEGLTFTSDTTGTLLLSGASFSGCDSLVHYSVTINHTQHTVVEAEGCNTYTWAVNGNTYRQSTNQVLARSIDRFGCDSIIHLHLTIHHDTVGDEYVRACDSFVINGQVFGLGNHLTRYNTTSVYGCDSLVTVHLTVNPSNTERVVNALHECGDYYWAQYNLTFSHDIDYVADQQVNRYGCDSSAVLHLRIFQPTRSQIASNADSCDRYIWNGIALTADTTITGVVATNAQGCDSIQTLVLKLRHSDFRNFYDTICDEYRFEGRRYRPQHDTVFTKRLGATTSGCSILEQHFVRVNHSVNNSEEHTVCGSYRWSDSLYTQSGRYTNNSKTVAGCDSVSILVLQVNPVETVDYTQHVCQSYTWPLSGLRYTASTVDTVNIRFDNRGCAINDVLHLTVDQPSNTNERVEACDFYRIANNGLFRKDTVLRGLRFQTAGGCDSVVNLTIKINSSSRSQINATVCDIANYWGTDYTTSGTYTHIEPNAAGCDSTITLYLAVNSSDTTYTSATACDSYSWNGQVFTSSTRGQHTSVNPEGCQRTEYVDVTILRSSKKQLAPVSVCDEYEWNGDIYTESQHVEQHLTNAVGCDSVISFDLKVRQSTSHQLSTVDACESFTWKNHVYTETNENASYRVPAGNKQGCDSMVYRSIRIHPKVKVNDTVYACESYTWAANGREYTRSNKVGPVTLATEFGCDSVVTLVLRIGAGHVDKAVDLEGCDELTWKGRRYTSSYGPYRYTVTDQYGCDSNYTVNIHIGHSTHGYVNLQACDSIMWNNQLFTTSVVNQTVRLEGANAEHCDSLVHLNLTMNNTTRLNMTQQHCDHYTWLRGTTFYRSVEADTVIRHAGKCDTIAHLSLTITGNPVTEEVLSGCGQVVYNGYRYTNSDSIVTTATTADGCLSTHIVRIDVRPAPTSDQYQLACESYTWPLNGRTYTASVVATQAVPSRQGCDSIVTLHLTVNYDTVVDVKKVSEDYFFWEGQKLTNSGTYSHTYTRASGCDSVVNLHLSISNVKAPEIVVSGNILMVNHYPDGANGGMVEYDAYRWYRNNTLIPNATNDYYTDPTGRDLYGCYYVEVPVDAAYSSWVASNTICVGTNGIDDIDDNALTMKAMPNPVRSGSMLTVATTLTEAQLAGLHVELYDLQGRMIYSSNRAVAPTFQIHASFAPGVYTLRLTTADRITATQKIVVR